MTDERDLFERLCLEAFQSGLSWTTILRKRENFRRAFHRFDPDAVAAFGPPEVERLLEDASIVRNRQKIEATIANARAAIALREAGGSLSSFIWSYAPEPRPAPQTLEEIPPSTPESIVLAKALKQRGFRFLGPTTVYASMQACGLVNDHVTSCFVRGEVASAQAQALRRLRRSPA